MDRERLLGWVSRPLYRAAVATVLIAYLVVFPGWYPDNYIVIGESGFNVTVAPFSVSVNYTGPEILNASGMASYSSPVQPVRSYSLCEVSLAEINNYANIEGYIGASIAEWNDWNDVIYSFVPVVPLDGRYWFAIIFTDGNLHYVEVAGKGEGSDWSLYLENDLGELVDLGELEKNNVPVLVFPDHIELDVSGFLNDALFSPGRAVLEGLWKNANVTYTLESPAVGGKLIIAGEPGLKFNDTALGKVVGEDEFYIDVKHILHGDCHVDENGFLVLDEPGLSNSTSGWSGGSGPSGSSGSSVVISPSLDARDNYLILYKSGGDYYISLKGLAKLYSIFWITIIVFWVYKGWGVSV